MELRAFQLVELNVNRSPAVFPDAVRQGHALQREKTRSGNEAQETCRATAQGKNMRRCLLRLSSPQAHCHLRSPGLSRSPFSHRYYTTTCIMSSPAGVKRNADHISSSPTIDNNKKPKSNGSITSFFGAPKAKPTGAQPATASSSFNKQKWVDSLTQEQKDLLQLEINTMDESWLARLKDEVVTPEFLALKQFLKKEKEAGVKIFPPENEIYSWYRTVTPVSCSKGLN